MDTDQFLSRVVAPGNYLAIGYNRPAKDGKPGGFSHRFFRDEDVRAAAGFLRWCSSRGWDAYHAVASFVAALPDGQDNLGNSKFRGERVQSNAHRLRCFWVDLDVKRQGDKKKPGMVWDNAIEALRWLTGFVRAIGLPPPNLMVNSGYGMHAYWVLEEPLLSAAWQPYADALRTVLIKHGFVGDAGISSDAARILRPPGTVNMKAGTPAPVSVLSQLTRGDYPNELVLKALQPFVALAQARPQAQSQVQMQGHALAGGGGAVVQSIFANQATPNMTAAAQTGLPPASRPREFAAIATACHQVMQSLSNHGDGDSYPLWYLGHLTLAHHTTDGAAFIHPISDGDPRYSAADTDTAFARVAREHGRKNMGPPSCQHYERARPGVCVGCPHFGKIHSPWDLGVDHGDLPERYRRGTRGIEYQVRTKLKEEWHYRWELLLAGDVHSPVLDSLPLGGFALTFTYERAGKSWSIRTVGQGLTPDSAAIYRFYEPQGITLLPPNELPWRSFVLGWIDKLREQRADRDEVIAPFGWAETADGKHIGFAVGGTLYRADGNTQATPGGDPQLIAAYKPKGELAQWRNAFDFVTKDRPDLQVLVAGSFGAPLMPFTGHSGVAIGAWSRQSAVGKTSAMKLGQSVWASLNTMNSLDDTNNAAFKKIADSRSMPCLWDEMRVNAGNSEKMVNLALSLSQGKGKARMRSDTTLAEVGEWETLLVCAANHPLMDHITAATDGTDAGAVRLFEYAIAVPPTSDTSQAARIIALTKTNHGHAGRIYAKWLATNHDAADRAVCAIKDKLNTELGAQQEERFYIAGLSVLLAGATIANSLGLTSFDVKAMKGFLTTEFFKLRRARKLSVVVSSSGYDLEQVLGSFSADTLRHKIITSCFAAAGPKQHSTFKVLHHPQDGSRVDVQIAHAERIMRINRSVFIEWCRKKQYSPSDVIDTLGSVWGASVSRKTIAAGCGYGGGQVWCIEIPLTTPELASYLNTDTSAQPLAPAAPAPAKALRGSQPKV